MTSDKKINREISRRAFLKTAVLTGATVAFSPLAPNLAIGADKSRTLVIAASATPNSLDNGVDGTGGAAFDAFGILYDGTLELAKVPSKGLPDVLAEDLAIYPDKVGNMNYKGKLAEKWEIEDNGRVVRLFLRQGVKSNWGNELTAEDVKYSYDRKFGLPEGVGSFHLGVMGLKAKEEVKVEGRYVVSFNIDTPNPLLLRNQVNLGNHIFDSTKCKAMSTADDPWAHKFLQNDSAGFGPYRVTQLTRGQQAIFEARDDYYAGKPYFHKVVLKEVPSSSTRVALLQRGAVDIAQNLQPLEYNTLKKAKGVALDIVPSSLMMFGALNCKTAPLDNVKVRQAMNLAFPHEDVIQTAYFGMADLQTAPMPNHYPMVTHQFWQYDSNIEKAKTLLKEAGLDSGFKTTITYFSGDPIQESIAIMYQTSLRKIGVELSLKKVPNNVYWDMFAKKTDPLLLFVDSPWTPDPGYALSLFFESGSFVNMGNYSNKEVDKLIAEGKKTIDAKRLKQIYTRVQEILMAEAPWIYIAYPHYVLARREDIKGWTYYTSNNLRYQDLRREA